MLDWPGAAADGDLLQDADHREQAGDRGVGKNSQSCPTESLLRYAYRLRF